MTHEYTSECTRETRVMHALRPFTFAETRNPTLVAKIVDEAFDRPSMLRDGADTARLEISGGARYFIAVLDIVPLGLFATVALSADLVEIHVILRPCCRGARAVAVSKAFLGYLRETTNFRRACGFIPAYNRPMLRVAMLAGMRRTGRRSGHVFKLGKPVDEVIVGCELQANF
jgi:hypothetical protein